MITENGKVYNCWMNFMNFMNSMNFKRQLSIPSRKLVWKFWSESHVIEYSVKNILHTHKHARTHACTHTVSKKYSYKENIKKKTIFLKSKYYPMRNESSIWCGIDIDTMILTPIWRRFVIWLTIISHWVINNLFIENIIDCMFVKIISTK